MKHNKPLAILLVLALFCSLFAFVACEDKPITGKATVVVGDTTYTVDYQQNALTTRHDASDLLVCIANQTKDSANAFFYGASFSATGMFITSASGLTLATPADYVAMFTNDEQYQDTSAYCLPNKTVNGVTYYYSGVGISAVKLVDGLSILLCVETYGA